MGRSRVYAGIHFAGIHFVRSVEHGYKQGWRIGQ
jgi:hypothetical protein